MGELEKLAEALDSPLLATIDRFDEQRVATYDWLSEKIHDLPPYRSYEAEAQKRIDRISATFGTLGMLCLQGGSIKKAKLDITEIWIQDEHMRMDWFGSVTNDDQFIAQTKHEVGEIMDLMFEGPIEAFQVGANLRQTYRAFAETDVMAFTNHIEFLRRSQNKLDLEAE